jgi:hypothetical protein
MRYIILYDIKYSLGQIMKLFISFLTLLTLTSYSFGGIAVISQISQTNTDNRAYAGLKWTLNEGIKPQAVIGFRHAKTESNGDTNGGDISISAKLIDGFQLGKVRAKYINGKENTQAEAGAGYDFINGIFAGISVHAPYSNLGVDLLPTAKDKIEPYLQLDTIKGIDKPAYVPVYVLVC